MSESNPTAKQLAPLSDEQIERLRKAVAEGYDLGLGTAATVLDDLLRLRAGIQRLRELRQEWASKGYDFNRSDEQGKVIARHQSHAADEILKGFM